MDTMAHWPLGFVAVFVVMALTSVGLLNGTISRLVGCQVGSIRVDECLGDDEDVGDEAVEKIQGH